MGMAYGGPHMKVPDPWADLLAERDRLAAEVQSLDETLDEQHAEVKAWESEAKRLAADLATVRAERDDLAAEVERLLDLVDAVEDDLGPDYLTALTEEADRG